MTVVAIKKKQVVKNICHCAFNYVQITNHGCFKSFFSYGVFLSKHLAGNTVLKIVFQKCFEDCKKDKHMNEDYDHIMQFL